MAYDVREEQRAWLANEFARLPARYVRLLPSQWAEQHRNLPQAASSLPGRYRYEVTPYLKEIVDCLCIDSSVRELSIMKGAQLGITVGVIENGIGYYIFFVKSAPMMFLTADSELAKLRLDTYIIPMIQQSGLSHLIRSADQGNARKTGQTEKKLEWYGGGFLVPFGAINANKLRSLPIRVLLRDEIDTFADVVGKDGDPLQLSAARTTTFEATYKIVDVSTPTILGSSKIEKRFRLGDQRYYFVRCLKCGFAQRLRWHHVDAAGVVSGMVWETQDERLVEESVRYLCQNCHHEHLNDDKTRLLSPAHGAEWRPSTTAVNPHHRSYHISSLYSPVGMQTWAALVRMWLEAWDPVNQRARDIPKLQVFYNNCLGEPFEVRGEKMRLEQVSPHRRKQYRFGEIPNRALCEPSCGGPVLLLTAAVDVHKDNLAVAVVGWCRDRRIVLVEYERFIGNTENLQDAATWGRLRELLEQKWYVADDGKRYRIQLTCVDSGYNTDIVYQFCAEYTQGVFPVKGQEPPETKVKIEEFSEFTNRMGLRAFGVNVNLYKDRLSLALKQQWSGLGLQPPGHFNAPVDIDDKQLRELTVESKHEEFEKETGRRVSVEWRRPSGAPNELWDTLVYNSAAFDIAVWDTCLRRLGLDSINLPLFYQVCEEHQPFYSMPDSA